MTDRQSAPSGAPPSRVLLVGAGVALLLTTVVTLSVQVLVGFQAQRATFDELLVALAACVLLLAAPWCGLAALLTCVDALRGRTERRGGVPSFVHRWVLIACGAAVLAAAAPAHAAGGSVSDAEGTVRIERDPAAQPGSTGRAGPAGQAGATSLSGATYGAWAAGISALRYADHALDGLPLPDRPVSTDRPAPAAGSVAGGETGTESHSDAALPTPRETPRETPEVPPETPQTPQDTPQGGSHVVVRGESLWLIAAAHLEPDATDAEIAALTSALYATHRTAIGSDPDVIHPGLRLDIDRAMEHTDRSRP